MDRYSVGGSGHHMRPEPLRAMERPSIRCPSDRLRATEPSHRGDQVIVSTIQHAPRATRLDRWAVLLTFSLMPPAFLSGFLSLPDSVFGRDPWLGGWFWTPVGLLSAAAVFVHPPSHQAIGKALPYLLFLLLAALSLLWTEDPAIGVNVLGRWATVALLYLAAWSATRGRDVLRKLRTMSVAWILLISTVFFAAALVEPDVTGTIAFQRLMGVAALNLVALFVPATIDRSFRFTIALGLLTFLACLAAGARMASLVLIVLFLLAPSWAVSRQLRVGGALVIVAAVALLSLSFFDGRGFTTAEDTIPGVASFVRDADLGGRAELWPAVVDRCHGAWPTGRGVGSSNVYARAFRPTFNEPHNEYLRVSCDVGVVGSALLWSFVAMVAVRAVRAIWRTKRPAGAAYASLQFVAALLLLAATDIPLTATIQFLAPAAITWAWSDRLSTSASTPPPRPTSG